MKNLHILLALLFYLPLQGNAQLLIQAKQKPLSELLSSLNQEYGLQYSYKDKIANDCLINLEGNFSSLESALQSILAICEMRYQLIGEVYLIEVPPKTRPVPSIAKSDCVFNGRLLDAKSGEGLGAVVIEYEGGKTLSDQNGYFSLPLSKDQNRVQFSHIIYQPLDTFLTDNQSNTLTLKPQNYYLDEVLIKEEVFEKEDYGVELIKAIHANELSVGFFLSFDEFAQNNPSKPYKTYPQKRRSHELDQVGRSEYYRFMFSRDSARQINSIYGFSDGEAIYICLDSSRFKHNSRFVRMNLVGPFAYFQYTECLYGETEGSVTRREVIDLRTGQRNFLTKRFLRPLLAADPVLSAEYESKIFKGNIGEAFFYRFYQEEPPRRGLFRNR